MAGLTGLALMNDQNDMDIFNTAIGGSIAGFGLQELIPRQLSLLWETRTSSTIDVFHSIINVGVVYCGFPY